MTFKHIIEDCFEDKIGASGIKKKAYGDALKRANKIFDDIKSQNENDSFPIFSNLENDKNLPEAIEVATKIADNFDELVVLGTGGSTLNPQSLVALKQPHEGIDKRVYFIDSVDPDTVSAFLGQLDLETTAFLVTSKSGKTVETIAQFLILISAFDEEKIKNKGEHFFIISDEGENPIRTIAKDIGATILNHETEIGGRFATFTNVSLIPAIVTGFDATAFRKGAKFAMDKFLKTSDNESVKGAALAYSAMNGGLTNNVMMPYADRLASFSVWYRQIWAESLGKEGNGSTPIKAIGSLDQHSQLQLYLDGPKDKLFNVISLGTSGVGEKIDDKYTGVDGLDYLQGKTIGDVNYALQQATIQTLIKNNCPVREIRLKKLDEYVLGELMLHFIMETVITAGLLDISPFGQPAVEDGKILARNMLKG